MADARGSHRNEEHEPGRTTLCLRRCGISSHKTAFLALAAHFRCRNRRHKPHPRKSVLQNEREISAGLVEKLLKLDRPVAERFYALYREQFNPILRYPDAVIEEWISVGTFRAKEKITVKPQQVVDWTFAERDRR